MGEIASSVETSVGGQQEYAAQCQHDRADLRQARCPMAGDADDDQHDGREEILHDRGYAGGGVLDGCEVQKLTATDACNTVDKQVDHIAPIFEGSKELLSIFEKEKTAHDKSGQKEPDRHEPSGVHMLAGEKILADAAGNAPADAAE